MNSPSSTALVTGGGGFLGGAIVRRLLQQGDRVHVLTRNDYPDLRKAGAHVFQGDLGDIAAVERASENCDVVYHVAAKAGVWGDRRDYERTNVTGTQNVIDVCRKLRIPKLIFTSSPSVTFAGRDQRGVNETESYPARYLTDYPRTKALAEQMVLAANDSQLATVALRPHLIWGPGDNHLIPRLIERGKKGQIRIVGNGRNLVDVTFIENAVDAHLCAAARLDSQAACAGNAYFISDGHPVNLWEFINRVLAIADVSPVTRSVPSQVAYTAGGLLEAVYKVSGRKDEPRMTRFVARQLATSHWFDISGAERDLGYVPRVSLEEGLASVSRWLGVAR